MPTSGSSDYTLTARQVVDYALKKISVVGMTASVDGDNMARGIRELNLMLKGWQTAGPSLWRRTTASQSLVADTAAYTPLTKPYRVLSCRYRDANGRDLPMEVLTADEYDELPLKTSRGIPTTYYFDAQRDGGTIYIWPVLAAVTTETLQYTYQRRFEDIDDAADNLDVPSECLDLVGYNLASRLLDDYGIADAVATRIERRAAMLVSQFNAADREPLIRFEPALR